MNFRKLSFTLATLAAGAVSLSGQELPAGGTAPENTAAAVEEFPIDQILEVYGWFLGEQMQVFAFGMSDEEIAALNRGIALAAKGKQPTVDLEKVGPALQAFLATRPDEVFAQRTAEGRAEEQALFERLERNPAVQKTASGLRYEILEPGSNERPTLGDTIVAHYTGTFVDGTVFDTSADEGEPVEFALNNVIEGWQEGLRLIGVGGHIKLYIPAALAYGDTGNRNIPPAKPLIFDVELLGIRPRTPAAGDDTP